MRAAGEGPAEVERVMLEAFAAFSRSPLATRRARQREVERLAVATGPFGDGVGDQAAVVPGVRPIDVRWPG